MESQFPTRISWGAMTLEGLPRRSRRAQSLLIELFRDEMHAEFPACRSCLVGLKSRSTYEHGACVSCLRIRITTVC